MILSANHQFARTGHLVIPQHVVHEVDRSLTIQKIQYTGTQSIRDRFTIVNTGCQLPTVLDSDGAGEATVVTRELDRHRVGRLIAALTDLENTAWTIGVKEIVIQDNGIITRILLRLIDHFQRVVAADRNRA